MNLETFYKKIEQICPTYHYESQSEELPRQVYTEYATDYDYASNEMYTKKISINLNHYSKEEFDKTEKALELLMLLDEQTSFSKETSFDEQTKIITNFYDIEITEEISCEQLKLELNNLLKVKEEEK